MNNKREDRQKRHRKIRTRLRGTAKRPRLAVFKSNRHIYAQLIDDDKGVVLATASDGEVKEAGKADVIKSANVKDAEAVGKLIAEKASKKKISEIVFDRGGFIYHGLIKAVAEGARKAKLKF